MGVHACVREETSVRRACIVSVFLSVKGNTSKVPSVELYSVLSVHLFYLLDAQPLLHRELACILHASSGLQVRMCMGVVNMYAIHVFVIYV